MQAQRQPHESVWRRCFEATYPERGQGLGGDDVMTAQTAQNKRAEQMDSTAADAVRLLTSSIMSGMTPANDVWFALDAGDETDEERRWLDGVAKFLWEQIHGANYDAAKFEAVLDSVAAGWFCLFIPEGDTLTFEQWPLAQVKFRCSKAGGLVDTVIRRFKLSAEQAMNAYGDACSDKVKDAAAQGKLDQFEFVMAIYPRADYVKGSRLAKNLPIASCHVEVATKQLVRESGYHEMPAIVPRWMTLPGSDYAVGPVSAALPTINELNTLLQLESQALSRAAAGVYVAEDDGVLNPRVVKVKGGSVIVANSVDSIKELPSGADFNVTFSKADQLRAEIRRILMADQLQPQDGPAMTATEVHVRVALIRQLLGPLFGRFQAEDLAPTITRVFGMAYRAGLLGTPPDTLRDRILTIRYQSPLARAQKLEEVTAVERLAANAGAMVQSGFPEAADLIDVDNSLRLMADGLGAPAKALRDEKAVAKLRDKREKQQQQAMQQEQAMVLQQEAAKAAMNRAAKVA
jgi:hypothetical protein